MKACDIFGIILRTLAVIILLYGLWCLMFAITTAWVLRENSPSEMTTYLTSGIPLPIIGLLLLRYARQIVRFAYPRDQDDSNPTTQP